MKPCPNPKCKSEIVIANGNEVWGEWVECSLCGMTGPACDTVKAGIDAWDALPRGEDKPFERRTTNDTHFI